MSLENGYLDESESSGRSLFVKWEEKSILCEAPGGSCRKGGELLEKLSGKYIF